MDSSERVELIAGKALAEKLDLIKAFCKENLETRSEDDYLAGYEDACEKILKLTY